jgi:hypothetical protein
MEAKDGFLENGDVLVVAMEDWEECMKGTDALRAGRED